MYAIGNITCETENHGHTIVGDIKASIDNKKYPINNYSYHKDALDEMANKAIYTGRSPALFSFNFSGKTVDYIPLENIENIIEKDAE
jgi:hypothetical protein